MTNAEMDALVRRANAAGFSTVAEYAVSLEEQCAVCERCGHHQPDPNWCNVCRHRTTPPGWARPLLSAWFDRQDLREAIADALTGMEPGVWPHGLLSEALTKSESLGVSQ